MKLLVFQLEDRDNELLNNFMSHNRTVCSSNNIEYINKKKSDFNSPPYWNKIFELQKIMNEKKNIDYIFWVDSDAFFVNFDKNKIINFLKKNNKYSIIITKDMPPWNHNFNAGVFIIKNNKMGKQIIDKWVSKYNKNRWSFDSSIKEWKTEGNWGGDDYEQGAFITYLLKDENLKPHIMVNPYYVLNNNNCLENMDESFLVHLAGHHKKDINTVNSCLKLLNKENFTDLTNVDSSIFYRKILIILIIIIIIFLITKNYTKYIKYIK
jgi:hypothetical protein